MSSALDMDGVVPAMTSFTTQPPDPGAVQYEPLSCASGLIGCADLISADNGVASALLLFTTQANAGFTGLETGANNSGFHYLDGSLQSDDALSAPQAPVAIEGVTERSGSTPLEGN